MKKKQKRILGYLGFVAVVGMTTVAASIPIPGALATTTTITDTIEVRVVGSTPAVALTSNIDDKIISSPDFLLNVAYENATKVTLYRTYIGADGSKEEPVEIATYDNLDYTAGEVKNAEFTVDKYGTYIISAEAVGYDDALTAPEDYVTFKYLPVSASLGINQNNGKYEVTIESASDEVKEIEILVNNVLVGTLKDGDFEQLTSFAMPEGTKEGTYTVMIVAKDANGKAIYVPFTIEFYYKPEGVPDAGAPDTGGLFKNTNISKEDYLVTGLIMFFVLGIVAFGVVARNRKPTSKKRR